MDKTKDTILITGATGQQGGAVAHELSAKGYRLRAMTRKASGEKAQALRAKGMEVVEGNLDDAASLARALEGAWGVYGVQNTWEAGVEGEETQGKRLAEAAKKAGVVHYVYASVASAHRKTGIPHFDNKARIEDTVRAQGFPSWTVIRPVFFMENLLSPWFKPGIDGGSLAFGMEPTTRLQMIAVEDIGKYGALAFERHAEMNGVGLDIAGDAKTGPEAAEVLSRVTGRPISFVRVPIAEVRKFSDDYATMLEWFDRVGYDADIAGNAKKYGIRPTTFEEWAARQKWNG
jgi:uncharacterized protein YbjT (DUF2867 family)